MKAINIARVSTEEQKEMGCSLSAQLNRMKKHCEDNGFEVIKEFSFDESAYKQERIEFDKIVLFIKSQTEKVVVCFDKLDRMSRNIFDTRASELYEMAINDEIELRFVSDGLKINCNISAAEKFQFSMSLGLSKYYSDAISDNVKRALDEKTRKGEWGGPAPFGYRNIPKSKGVESNIVIDEDNGRVVQAIFDYYATGAYSIDLLREKIKEEFGISILKGTLGKMLSNPFYYGMMRKKGKLYPHRYDPLISKDLFDRVQEIKNGFSKKPVKYKGKNYVYRGLLKCEHCGCLISPDRKKGKYVYYQCTQYHGKHGAKRFKEEELTEMFADVFKRIQVPKNILDRIVEALSKTHKDKVAIHNQRYDQLTKEGARITKRMDRLYEDRLDGKISDEHYDRFYERLRSQKDDVSAKLERLQEAEDNYYITAKYLLELGNRAHDLFESSEVDERRLLIKLVLSNLRVKDEKVLYDVNKPFKMIMDCHDRQSWRG